MNVIRGLGRGLKYIATAIGALAISGGVLAVANYAITQGAGTNFGSVLVGGVHYAQQFICDLTTPAQCASVSVAGAVKVDGSAVTQPVSGTVTATGTIAATQSGTWTVQPGNTANTTAWKVDNSAVTQPANVTQMAGSAISASCVSNYGTSPGAVACPSMNAFVTNATAIASTAGAVVPNNTTAVVVKASAGTIYGIQVYGIGSAPAYLKLYNATSATCGSGTPVKRIMIPAASTAANGAGSNVTFGAAGVAFGTGITYCVTTGITDADNTAPAASTFLVNVDFS